MPQVNNKKWNRIRRKSGATSRLPFVYGSIFPLFAHDISQAKSRCLYGLVRVRPAVVGFFRLYAPYSSCGRI